MTDTEDSRLLLADFLLDPAVEVIVQAFGRVARFVTLAVVEDAPAVRVNAVCPRVYSQRAVSSVPVASERVALLVTDAVVGLAVAVGHRADGHRHSRFLLTAFTPPTWQTLAAEEGEGNLLSAHATVPTRLGQAALVSTLLALCAHVALWARAACATRCQRTATAVIAR